MMRDSTGQLFTVSGFASDLQLAFQSFYLLTRNADQYSFNRSRRNWGRPELLLAAHTDMRIISNLMRLHYTPEDPD